jgi:hypothetical protein
MQLRSQELVRQRSSGEVSRREVGGVRVTEQRQGTHAGSILDDLVALCR